jgi:hypothetical protein
MRSSPFHPSWAKSSPPSCSLAVLSSDWDGVRERGLEIQTFSDRARSIVRRMDPALHGMRMDAGTVGHLDTVGWACWH